MSRHALSTRQTCRHWSASIEPAQRLAKAWLSPSVASDPRRWNTCSMTSQGHPYARFRRAIERRSVAAAWATATELEQVSLAGLLVARTSRARPRTDAIPQGSPPLACPLLLGTPESLTRGGHEPPRPSDPPAVRRPSPAWTCAPRALHCSRRERACQRGQAVGGVAGADSRGYGMRRDIEDGNRVQPELRIDETAPARKRPVGSEVPSRGAS